MRTTRPPILVSAVSILSYYPCSPMALENIVYSTLPVNYRCGNETLCSNGSYAILAHARITVSQYILVRTMMEYDILHSCDAKKDIIITICAHDLLQMYAHIAMILLRIDVYIGSRKGLASQRAWIHITFQSHLGFAYYFRIVSRYCNHGRCTPFHCRSRHR